MVYKEKFEGEMSYKCEACGFHYRNRETAEKCEKHCKQYNACNMEITSESIERSG
ncbi:MAG: hypothetical protein ABEJ69_00735 [Candidatus Nanohaloarchaea archaeon]